MYSLAYDRRIEKDLRRIPAQQRRLILHRIEQLSVDPRVLRLRSSPVLRVTACESGITGFCLQSMIVVKVSLYTESCIVGRLIDDLVFFVRNFNRALRFARDF